MFSLGFTHFHLVSHVFTWFHIFSLGFTHFHLVSHIFTWFHTFSPWFHTFSLVFTCFHTFSPWFHTFSLVFTRFHGVKTCGKVCAGSPQKKQKKKKNKQIMTRAKCWTCEVFTKTGGVLKCEACDGHTGNQGHNRADDGSPQDPRRKRGGLKDARPDGRR